MKKVLRSPYSRREISSLNRCYEHAHSLERVIESSHCDRSKVLRNFLFTRFFAVSSFGMREVLGARSSKGIKSIFVRVLAVLITFPPNFALDAHRSKVVSEHGRPFYQRAKCPNQPSALHRLEFCSLESVNMNELKTNLKPELRKRSESSEHHIRFQRIWGILNNAENVQRSKCPGSESGTAKQKKNHTVAHDYSKYLK